MKRNENGESPAGLESHHDFVIVTNKTTQTFSPEGKNNYKNTC